MIITDGREMYLASSTGRVRRIGRGCFGAWAPDGSRIAYAANGWIYTSRPDGSDARRLVEGVNVRDWSSDGKRILFLRVVERPGCRVLRLFVLRPGTGRAVQLTGNTRLDRDGVEHERPGQRWGHFSADGRYVAFAEFRACDSGGVPEYEPHAFVADPASPWGAGTPTG
jgi:Tol biopolymer transport system component